MMRLLLAGGLVSGRKDAPGIAIAKATGAIVDVHRKRRAEGRTPDPSRARGRGRGSGPWLAAAIGLLLLAGCRSAPAPRRPLPTARGPVASGPEFHGPVAARVVSTARSALGARYRYAGAGPRGFDCSGLTSWAFAAAGVALPRTAAAQSATGRWVALDELRAGDLVFFSKAKKADHVGLVVSAPGEPLRMIHASSSRGVVETDVLASAYWLDRLRFGRRVLPGG